MRATHFHLATVKETPADAEIASHQLMVRAGMIRKLTSGIYSWTPLGLRVLRKVETIVREEMDRAGCLEMLMPAVQPAELWRETGRWEEFGPQLLKIVDRAQRDFCFGPTHEEVVTDFARAELRSYKQLPICFYQIQTKFRDEIRPRFGIMRAREFLMKDAYSFHIDDESMEATYQQMHAAYSRIVERMGLPYRAVEADSGAIGGSVSHEFQVLADSGEDAIAFCPQSKYAANVEAAEGLPESQDRPSPQAELSTVNTPDQRSIDEVCRFLKISPQHCLKTLIVKNGEDELFALVLRGDHQLNEVKLGKLAQFADGFEMATEERIKAVCNCQPGFVGPVGLNLPIIADRSAAVMADFVCGHNENGKHFTRRQLGAGCQLRRGCRPARGSCRRPESGRQGATRNCSRHRGRSHLQVGRQILALHERDGPQRARQVHANENVLLRSRCVTHRCCRHRAKPRRPRHYLARRYRAFSVGDRADQRSQVKPRKRSIRRSTRAIPSCRYRRVAR